MIKALADRLAEVSDDDGGGSGGDDDGDAMMMIRWWADLGNAMIWHCSEN